MFEGSESILGGTLKKSIKSWAAILDAKLGQVTGDLGSARRNARVLGRDIGRGLTGIWTGIWERGKGSGKFPADLLSQV